MLPRDVECPHCHAKVGHGCTSATNIGYSARTHLARWRVAGVQHPTAEQRHADYEDGRERDLAFREAFFKNLRERLYVAPSVH